MKSTRKRKRIIPTDPLPDDYREPWCGVRYPQPINRSDETGVFGQHSCFRDPAKIFEDSQSEKEFDKD